MSRSSKSKDSRMSDPSDPNSFITRVYYQTMKTKEETTPNKRRGPKANDLIQGLKTRETLHIDDQRTWKGHALSQRVKNQLQDFRSRSRSTRERDLADHKRLYKQEEKLKKLFKINPYRRCGCVGPQTSAGEQS